MTYFMRTRVAIAGFGEDAVAQRNGNSLGGPTDLYACKPVEGSDGANDYLYIIANNDRHFGALCETIGHPEFATEPRFNAKWRRTGMGHELFDVIAAWTIQRTKWEAMEQLGEAGVPAGAVLDTHDLFNNPHFEERGFIHELDHPEHGKIRLLGWAPRLSRSHVPDAPRAAPRRAQRRSARRRPRPRRSRDAGARGRRKSSAGRHRSPGSSQHSHSTALHLARFPAPPRGGSCPRLRGEAAAMPPTPQREHPPLPTAEDS